MVGSSRRALRKRYQFGGAGIIAAAILLCVGTSSVAAKATSFTAPASDFIFINAAEADCLGETATIYGDVHVVEDESGFHANLLGVYAVGDTSGMVYRIVGTTREDGSLTFNIVGGGPGHRVFEHVVVTGNGAVLDARSFICM